MANEPTTSFRLPDSKPVDVYLVKTRDGRLVARTAGELSPLPKTGPIASAAPPSKP